MGNHERQLWNCWHYGHRTLGLVLNAIWLVGNRVPHPKACQLDRIIPRYGWICFKKKNIFATTNRIWFPLKRDATPQNPKSLSFPWTLHGGQLAVSNHVCSTESWPPGTNQWWMLLDVGMDPETTFPFWNVAEPWLLTLQILARLLVYSTSWQHSSSLGGSRHHHRPQGICSHLGLGAKT